MSRQNRAADPKRSDPVDWVDRYGDLLFRYALVRLRDPALAEDAVQETFLSALKGRESFAGRSTERTWLVGILKHKIVDTIRKRSREQQVDDPETLNKMIDEDFDHNGRWRLRPASWTADAGALFEQKEFWQIFQQCLTGLPTRLAQVFSLRELNELTSKELCKVLDISPTNLWVILHRARHRLRQCIEANWFEPNPDGDL
jgi:RNA polymerase sigma-70 factor (ECF subfamily)